MDSRIKVSVIMPVYNAGVFLRKAIDSILSQSLREIELILVDDGSQDESPYICEEYAKADKRVKVIHQKNGGICDARNKALIIVKGDYISFSDHDDEFLPGFLENAYKKAIETKADVVKVSKKVLVTNNGRLIKERSNQLPDVIWGQQEIKEHYFDLFDKLRINCVWDSLFSRDFLKKNELRFNEFYRFGGEDYDITARYLPYVKILAMISQQYYIHYDRIGISTSSKFHSFKFEHNKYLVKVVFDNAIKIGVDLQEQLDRFNYFLTEFYINTAAALLSQERCTYPINKKIDILKDMRDHECIQFGYEKSKSLTIFRQGIKIGLSYFMYKHKFYRLLLLIHKFRHIQSNLRMF